MAKINQLTNELQQIEDLNILQQQYTRGTSFTLSSVRDMCHSHKRV